MGGGYNFETGIGIEVVIETVTVQLNCDTGQPSPPLHCFAFKHFRFVRALMIEVVCTAQCTWLSKMFPKWMFKTVDIARACSRIVHKWVWDENKAGRHHFGNGGKSGIEIEIVTPSTNFRHWAAFTIHWFV